MIIFFSFWRPRWSTLHKTYKYRIFIYKITICSLIKLFPNFEPVSYSVSSSNCCFLTHTQISQETGKMVWYSISLRIFHTVKDFSIGNEAEVDVFLNSLVFSMTQWMLTIWSLVPLPPQNAACTSGSSWFMYYWSLAWRILSIIWVPCEMSAIVQ